MSTLLPVVPTSTITNTSRNMLPSIKMLTTASIPVSMSTNPAPKRRSEANSIGKPKFSRHSEETRYHHHHHHQPQQPQQLNGDTSAPILSLLRTHVNRFSPKKTPAAATATVTTTTTTTTSSPRRMMHVSGGGKEDQLQASTVPITTSATSTNTIVDKNRPVLIAKRPNQPPPKYTSKPTTTFSQQYHTPHEHVTARVTRHIVPSTTKLKRIVSVSTATSTSTSTSTSSSVNGSHSNLISLVNKQVNLQDEIDEEEVEEEDHPMEDNNNRSKLSSFSLKEADNKQQQQQQQQQEQEEEENPAYHTTTHVQQQGTPSPSPPYTVSYVLNQHRDQLTEYEKMEIRSYDQVFFFSQLNYKQRTGTKSLQLHQQNKNGKEEVNGHAMYNDGYDDEKGDYLVTLHDHLAFRYEVLEPLGSGSFGQVLRCFDHQTKHETAIKIVRNRKKYKEQSMMEVELLQHLRTKANLIQDDHIIRMKDFFFFRNHLCISFELLGCNLYDFLKLRYFQGLQMTNLRQIATQLLHALVFLKQQNIIHCDLKPENILVRSCDKFNPTQDVTSISVIDFGSSCYQNATVFTYVQSRFYRSPEVILGFGYGCPIDMWSFGCILAELYTGHPLFAGENETEQVACMMEILNIPPSDFLAHCKRRKLFFEEKNAIPPGYHAHFHLHDDTFSEEPLFLPIHLINSRGRQRKPGTKDLATALKTTDIKFLNFLQACLEWNPLHRMTPEQALEDPWIQGLVGPPATAEAPRSSSMSTTSLVITTSAPASLVMNDHGSISSSSSIWPSSNENKVNLQHRIIR